MKCLDSKLALRSNAGRNLRLTICLALGLLSLAPKGWADEKFPVLKVGNNVFSNVTVTIVTPTDICFTYPGGMANAKLSKLTPELQQHFHYNATNAMALEKKQLEATAQYHAYLVSHPTPPPPNEDRPTTPTDARSREVLWRMDLPRALSQARSENKLVLLDFTGSDWCSWCMKFDHDILSADQFANYAKTRLVLVRLDYPRHTPQSDDLRQNNITLLKQFGVDAFPSVILLNSDGKELGRQRGYLEGGPNAFISELESFSRKN